MGFITPISEKEALQKSVLALAYVGDAVQSLYVRAILTEATDLKTDVLHAMATSKVKASAQAHLVEEIVDCLTDTERSVYLRGRNSSPHHRSKNQSGADYRKATGFEAVLGYLYLTGQYTRLVELLEKQHED